jgi:hypothetical protein
MATAFAFDVFLGHSSKDKATVRQLALRLRADGLRVWLDEWNIAPGELIATAIEKGLRESRTLVLVMSANSLSAEWPTLETQVVLFQNPTNSQRRFVPVRIDDAEIRDILKPFSYVDWRQRSEDEYSRLLDACRPSLLREEVDDLILALSDAFPSYRDFDRLLQTRLRENLNAIAPQVDATNADLAEVLPAAIQWFTRRGRILEFMQSALQEAPQNPVLQAKIKEVIAEHRRRWAGPPLPNEDPFEACILNGRLFVDRRGLRDIVRGLPMNAEKRVLAIQGPPMSGKTYSYQYMLHLRETKGLFELVYLDLKKEAPAKFRPQLLAQRIVRQMGRSTSIGFMPKEEDASSPMGWVQDLCDWVLGEVKASGKTWLIALDGFSASNLPPNSREMVKELVSRSADSDSLKVALLGYSDDLVPVQALPRVARETLTGFAKDHIKECFRLTANHHRIQLEEGALNEMVEDVWESANPSALDRTALLADRTHWWIKQMILDGHP